MVGIYRKISNLSFANIGFAIAWIQQCLGLRFSSENFTRGTAQLVSPINIPYQLQVHKVMIICEKLPSSWLII